MASGFFLGAEADEDVIDLDMTYYKELQHFYRTVPTVKHCCELIQKFLFSDFKINGARPVLQQFSAEYFMPFFRQCLRQILLVGWVVWRTRKSRDPRTGKDIVVPELIPLEYVTVQLHVNRNTFEYRFQCYTHNSSEPLNGARFFLFNDAQRLAENGLVDSALDTILGDYRYVQQIKHFTMQAEFVRSNPTIYLRRVEGATGQAGLAESTGNLRRSVGVVQESRETATLADKLKKRLPKQQEVLEKASEVVSSKLEFQKNQMMSLNFKMS
jgi:hypothetical protein